MVTNSSIYKDDGTGDIPGVDSPWSDWVSASRTRNWCEKDPLLDWLDLHGEANGFVPDHKAPGYDPRTDFLEVLFARGNAFETAVMAHLGTLHPVRTIGEDGRASRDRDKVEAAWQAMTEGVPIIAQAPLWNPENRTYGIPDLLVRSDILAQLFPAELTDYEAKVTAPALGGSGFHYRVVDVKFTTLHLLKDGHAASKHLGYMAQVWIYNEALGRLQGYRPPCAYLLGRGWKTSRERGNSAMERLERVDHGHVRKNGDSLGDIVASVCEWIRNVRREGGNWAVLPRPSRLELRPNMGHKEDAPWHGAKAKIAEELADLTLLPRVNPTLRSASVVSGLERWDDPACNATDLGVTGETSIRQTDAVIQANHAPEDGPIVFPARVTAAEERWREPAQAEFFVDFETVNDLDDDFSSFPLKGGQPMIFMVGCGHADDEGKWQFRWFTADRLDQDEERRILQEWVGFLEERCAERGVSLDDARLYHWSPAEMSTLKTAYNSAAKRHGLSDWDDLPWVDLLNEVVKKQPVTVRGAFNFGLKSIAKAMHAHGLIETVWGDGPADGLGAMVGAWWCDREARERGLSMRALDLMKDIEQYNEVDCRTMSEVLEFLRRHR